MKTSIYTDLLLTFRAAQNVQPDQLVKQIQQCCLPKHLQSALCDAVLGDNRPLNNWVFTEGLKINQCIAWIAPVNSEQLAYVWMIGEQNQASIHVHKWFAEARSALATDPLLKQSLVSPPLLFVDTYAVSSSTPSAFGYEDEFAIFQVGYKNTPTEVTDLNQRMIINAGIAIKKRKMALDRMKEISYLDEITKSCLLENLEFFAVMHNEGHNQGHFVGAWPFDEKVKKKCIQYEAVEEFRSCLASVVFAEHLPLTQAQKDSYALSVFMTRFFGFGFEAFCLEVQRRETIREITVGLLFFEWLLFCNAIMIDQRQNLVVKIDKIRPALIDAYKLIFEQEVSMNRCGQNDLKAVARYWYQLAFPNSQYSQIARNVYDHMRGICLKIT